MLSRKRRSVRIVPTFDGLTIDQVLALHEWLFGPLDGRAKERLRRAAEENGSEPVAHGVGLAA